MATLQQEHPPILLDLRKGLQENKANGMKEYSFNNSTHG